MTLTMPSSGFAIAPALLPCGTSRPELIVDTAATSHGSASNASSSAMLAANSAPSPQTPKVALLVETSGSFGRKVLLGIARYVQSHGPWQVSVINAADAQGPLLRAWQPTGLIARIPDTATATAICEANVPTIAVGQTAHQVRLASSLPRFAELCTDAHAIAATAAGHLLDRRFRNFAFIGLAGSEWSRRREAAFCDYLSRRGYRVHVYPQSLRRESPCWEDEQSTMAAWIRSLPRPLGVFACNDERGRQVVDALRMADLRVPEEIAVLGVDDDEVFCELANPPLSSVQLDAEVAGYKAAQLLDALMRGDASSPRRILVDSSRVRTRQSTEVFAIDDEEVAAALKFIHQSRGGNILVKDVVAEVAVSRRLLERRFRAKTGRTIHEEIQVTRLNIAKRLLVETTLPIARIAESTGFGSASYFVNFFQARQGQTPREYRTASALSDVTIAPSPTVGPSASRERARERLPIASGRKTQNRREATK